MAKAVVSPIHLATLASTTITLSHINYEPVVFLGQTLSSSPEVKMKKADN